jgi:GT2 family glycosyltransferase
MNKISVLITCHNRKDKTLYCLKSLYECVLSIDDKLEIYIVDDGSTDGTSEAIQLKYPNVNIIKGNGSLFWCQGMRLAWQHAEKEDPDFYLWLNDDTILLPGAISNLLQTYNDFLLKDQKLVIVAASCQDNKTWERSYGGQIRIGGPPLIFKQLDISNTIQYCDTFHGNCVLIPRAVYKKVGILDKFQHGLGDIDYGLRAKSSGCINVIAPGVLALCEKNNTLTYWYKGSSRLERFKMLNSCKGLPFFDWLKFSIRHCGWKWFLYFPRPYLRILFNK